MVEKKLPRHQRTDVYTPDLVHPPAFVERVRRANSRSGRLGLFGGASFQRGRGMKLDCSEATARKLNPRRGDPDYVHVAPVSSEDGRVGLAKEWGDQMQSAHPAERWGVVRAGDRQRAGRPVVVATAAPESRPSVLAHRAAIAAAARREGPMYTPKKKRAAQPAGA